MEDFLLVLLQAVVTAAVPICTAYLVQFLHRKSNQISQQTESLMVKELLEQVTDAVTTAVTCTSQTYVDSLKKSGTFNLSAQKEALSMSLRMAASLLPEDAKAVLETLYGDVDAYLTGRIEAEVRKQKSSVPQD